MKDKRYPDITSVDQQGNTHYTQIGVANKNGSAVSREAKAMDDIYKATTITPKFVQYKMR